MKFPHLLNGGQRGEDWYEYAQDLEAMIKAERNAHVKTLRSFRKCLRELHEYQYSNLADWERIHGSYR
jgi:hypothetical protein